jgi:hypothetical protein
MSAREIGLVLESEQERRFIADYVDACDATVLDGQDSPRKVP